MANPKSIFEKLLAFFQETERAVVSEEQFIQLLEKKMAVVGMFETMRTFCEAGKIQAGFLGSGTPALEVVKAYTGGIFNCLVVLEKTLAEFEEASSSHKPKDDDDEDDEDLTQDDAAVPPSQRPTEPGTSKTQTGLDAMFADLMKKSSNKPS